MLWAQLLPLLQAVRPHTTLPLPLLLPEARHGCERARWAAAAGKGGAGCEGDRGSAGLLQKAVAVRVSEGLQLPVLCKEAVCCALLMPLL